MNDQVALRESKLPLGTRPLSTQLGPRLARRRRMLLFQELVGIESLLAFEHQPGGAGDSRRQDRDCLGLAVLLLQASHVGLSSRQLAEHQAGGLAKGPAELRIADLVALTGRLLAGALVARPHQAEV